VPKPPSPIWLAQLVRTDQLALLLRLEPCELLLDFGRQRRRLEKIRTLRMRGEQRANPPQEVLIATAFRHQESFAGPRRKIERRVENRFGAGGSVFGGRAGFWVGRRGAVMVVSAVWASRLHAE
jgi:hypothetical protein